MGLLRNCCVEMKFKINSSICHNRRRQKLLQSLVPILWKMSNEKISNSGFRWLIKIAEDIRQLLLCQWKHLLLFKCKIEKTTRKKIALTARPPNSFQPHSILLIFSLGKTKQKKKNRNCCWMWSGLCIFSRLSEKKRAGLCFESLQTCLGDNNSPDDACLASARLILPQLTQLLVILITTISSSALPPPRHIFRCLALTCCQCDLYSLFMCVRKHLWEKGGGEKMETKISFQLLGWVSRSSSQLVG